MFILFFSLFTGILFLLVFLENENMVRKKTKRTKKYPKISVIIPAYNESDNIVNSIKSVLRVDYPKDKVEVIVVDDDSIDDTFSQAKKMERKNVKVFTKEHGGKAAAVNFGIKKATGDILMILDADTFPDKKCFKNIVRCFDDENVMAVLPLIKIWKPKNIIEKCQVIEYTIMGLIKRSFTFLGSMACTPAGAFIKKSFVEKYGGFSTDTLTEDFEMGLRIQSKGYQIVQSLDSKVYTVVPNKLKKLLKQRIRWSYGTLENIKKYNFLISSKYGNLGMLFIPLNLIGIFLVSFVFLYYSVLILRDAWKSITLYSLIRFDIPRKFDFDMKISMLKFLTDEKSLLIFLSLILSFLIYDLSRRSTKEKFRLEYVFYVLIYGWIMGLAQFLSLIYFFIGKRPKW
jgi:cellulose synthase/poly-beta-1,6-N-acetylglucosamine synthase-like glycosyltransferase